ncbi:MAG: hypothetical protein JOY69_04945 [Candidatus Eremiobacteraeota bacterium]|nr:hypothetical protein [Candidatus Eremiobacteraeota bacterium]
MMLLAHVMGMPVEESLLPWFGGGLTGIVVVLASSMNAVLRKHRKT